MDAKNDTDSTTPYGSLSSSLPSPEFGSVASHHSFHSAKSDILASDRHDANQNDSVSKASSFSGLSASADCYERSIGEREPLLHKVAPASTIGLLASGNSEVSTRSRLTLSGSLHVSSNSSFCTCRNWLKMLKSAKPIFFCLVAVAFAVMLFSNKEISQEPRLMCVRNNHPQAFALHSNFGKGGVVTVKMTGPFLEDEDEDDIKDLDGYQHLTVGFFNQSSRTGKLPKPKTVRILANSSHKEAVTPAISKNLRYIFDGCNCERQIFLDFSCNNCTYCVAISFDYFEEPMTNSNQVVIAIAILVCVYLLIIFELVHRATAAMLGSLACIGTLSVLNQRPSLETILTWMEWETLALLFGMMILVGIFAETGFFDFVALQAYKFSRGHVWALITMLCVSVGLVSAVLDNVTTILLMTPVTVRLCQALNLDPTYILIAEVLFSNIGGTATAIGDPPNVIIVVNRDLKKNGINFNILSSHLAAGIALCLIFGYAFLRFLYCACRIRIQNPDPPIIAEMRREAEIWRRSAERVPIISPEEKTVKLLLLQKTMQIEQGIRNLSRTLSRRDAFHDNLKDMEEKYAIRDYWLLLKCSVVIIVVIIFFFIHTVIPTGLGIGWIAMVGAIFLILLADIHNIEQVLEKVEWATLVFFSALFVLMKGLKELGLVTWLGKETSNIIMNVDESSRLAVAIVAIIWISALASAFIDNIPFTTAMIPVIVDLHDKTHLPLHPLIFALAMGACLGGNGTLIGASANVVCAGLAEQQGYRITFNKFFKVGFPMMVFTNAVAMGYLLLCHCAGSWGNI